MDSTIDAGGDQRLRRLFNVALPSLLLLCLMLWGVVRAVSAPVYNWDVVGYVASALHLTGLRGEALLQATNTALANGVKSPEALQKLIHFSSFTETVHGSAQALQAQVPFYSPRLLYLSAMLVLGGLGVSLPTATVLLSAMLVAGVCCLLYGYLGSLRGYWPAALAVLLLAQAFYFPLLASASMPDAMACFFMLAGSLCLMTGEPHRGRLGLVAALFVGAMLSRHDSVLHIVIFSSIVLLMPESAQSAQQRLGKLALVVMPSLLCYALLGKLSGWYGWHVLLVHTFVAPMPLPAQATLPPAWPVYLQQVQSAIAGLTQQPLQSRELLTLLAAALAWRWAGVWQRRLLLACVLEVFVRFALFPAAGGPWLRFYLTPLLLIWLVVSEVLPSAKTRTTGL